jgi:hypothetical protein
MELVDFFYYEKSHSLNDEETAFIDHCLGYNFPYYQVLATDKDERIDKQYIFAHTLMKPKIDSDGKNINEEGVVNSPYYYAAIKIFRRFCEENNIPYSKILRAALNVSHHSTYKYGAIHVDHKFPHYNFLMYLNDFTDGNTYIFDDNLDLLEEVIPEKNKVVVFDGKKHAQGFCAPNEKRIVLVVTFT